MSKSEHGASPLNFCREFNYNLKQLSFNCAAISYWEQDGIKSKIQEFFIHQYFHEFLPEKNTIEEQYAELSLYPQSVHDCVIKLREKWGLLTKTILEKLSDYLDSMHLPCVLKNELIIVTKETGFQIFNFYICISIDFKELKEADFINYINNLYWTNRGTIDYVKTLEAIWGGNPKYDCWKSKLNNFETFDLVLVKKEIKKEFKKHLKKHKKWPLELHVLLYEEFYNSGVLSDDILNYMMIAMGIKQWHFYVKRESVNENLLKFSVNEGFPRAVKFFWNRLNEEEKKRQIDGCFTTLNCFQIDSPGGPVYVYLSKMDRYLEITLFLTSEHMKINNGMIFVTQDPFEGNENDMLMFEVHDTISLYLRSEKVMKMLLKWPWQQFFVPTFKLIWSYDVDWHITNSLMYIASEMETSERYLPNGVKSDLYGKIFRTVWHLIPFHLRHEIGDYHLRRTIHDLICIGDLSNLSLITHSQEVALDNMEQGQLLDYNNQQVLIDLAVEKKFEQLDQYIAALIPLPHSRNFKIYVHIKKIVKKTLQNWKEDQNLPDNETFSLLDEFLDWQSNSLEEREVLKKKIDILNAYRLFWKNDALQFLPKFLSWYSDSNNIAHCKDILKSDQHTWRIIADCLMMKDKEIGEKKFAEFSTFLFGCDETSRKEFLEKGFAQNKYFLIDALKNVIKKDLLLYTRIDNMFELCSLSPEKVHEFKQYFLEHVVIKICALNLKKGKFKGMHDVIKWALEDEEKAKDFIVEFMMRGRRLKDILGRMTKADESIASDREFWGFIDVFVKPLEHITHVVKRYKRNVWAYDDESDFDEGDFEAKKELINSILQNIQ